MMSPMPSVAASLWRSFLRPLALLAALATAFSPSVSRADTGDPSDPGYTGDVDPGAQDPQIADPDDEIADDDPSALSDFRDTLDPHGAWVQDPTYGTVWVPSSAEVGGDFAPYQSGGHWAVADSGDWLWVSDYDWGWVTFHYGRWVWAGAYWAWIPGHVYAPAWVTWRVGDGGYIGWAPLPPDWYWVDGVAVALWSIPYAAYCFVPTTAVFYNHVSTYVVRDAGVVRHAAGSTRAYHPASPTPGKKGSGKHRRALRPASPTFHAAGVPMSSVPKKRTPHDIRAMAFSTRRSSIAARAMRARSGAVPHASRGNAWQNRYDGFGRSVQGRARHTLSRSPSSTFDRGYRGSQYRGTPSFHSSVPSRMAPGHGGGSFHASAPSRGAGSFHAPSSRGSSFGSRTPSFHRSSSLSGARPSSTLSRPRSSGRGRAVGGRSGGRSSGRSGGRRR
jgi:hypothetical protein